MTDCWGRTITARARPAPRAPRAWAGACSAPRNSQALDDALGPLADHELLEVAPAGVVRIHVCTRLVAHRQHPRAHADRLVQLAAPRWGAAPRRVHAPALQAPGEVAVAEVEPHVGAERAQRLHDAKVSPLDAPAALVDEVGQPEGHEVGVGGDVRAVDLDVVAGVGDHDQLVGPTTSSMPRASFAPPVPPASTHDSGSARSSTLTPRVVRQAGDAHARVGIVLGIDRDHQRVIDSAMRAISKRPQSTQRSPSIRWSKSAAWLLSSRKSPQPARPGRGRLEVGQRGRADRVQGRDDSHPVGRHLQACCAADPCHTPSMRVALPADGGGQRHGGVDQELARAQRALDVCERLGLAAEGTLRMIVSTASTACALSGAREATVRHRRARSAPSQPHGSPRAIRSRSALPACRGAPPNRSRALPMLRRSRQDRRGGATAAEYRLSRSADLRDGDKIEEHKSRNDCT